MNAPIVVDGRTVQDHFPGIGRYAFHLISALAEQFPGQAFRVPINPQAPNARFDPGEWSRLPNIEPIPVRAGILSPSEHQLGRNARLARNTILWHAPFYTFPLSLSLPLVVTLGDLTPLILPAEMPNAARRTVYRNLHRVAAKRARAILTFSNASRADLVRLLDAGESKLTVVPLAADRTFQPASSHAIREMRAALELPEHYVLYLGSNKPHKNLARLVRAWAKVETDCALVIAGAWDARYPAPAVLIRERSLERRVLLRHAVPENSLPALLSGARTFVFPSVHEGFGLPPLEAMACGTPIACANASALPEVVGDTALLFDPLDEVDIERALNQLLNDDALRQRLGDAGMRRAREFSWERTARETMAVYQRVLEAR